MPGLVLSRMLSGAWWMMAASTTPEISVAGCSSPQAFAAALGELVGEDVLAASTASIRVDGDATEGAWTTTLEISGDRPLRRTLVAESCEAGIQAAVVVAAMALDPEMLMSGTGESEWMHERPRPAPAPPKAPTETAPAERPAAPPEPHASADPQAGPRWEAEVGVGGGLGLLPRAHGAAHVRIAARWDWVSVRAGASYVWPHGVDVGDSARARLQLWAATAGACYVASMATRWDAPLCAMATLGRMRGQGRGDGVRAGSGATTWGAAGLAALVRWWASTHVGVVAGFEGLGVFARPDLVIDGEGQACCSSPVVLVGTVGAAFRL